MSTIVDAANLAGFYARYAEVCKKGMEGLRKRDKKKAKKRKAKAGTGSKAG
jgi:signal recognition particle subunit SRP14